ncbi:Rid family hydrolase [Nonomuraea sp. NPDC050153]|uniref:Rid family hydrolase n=1 Tax=Nonomuraea sp. NPDC050153 TaxID=3364359 RepID=UPI00378E4580
MIAFLGQGRMGVPMARRLTRAGHKVTTWRRGSGVSAAEAVDGADLVVTMLSDPAAVREVLTAALPGLRPGTTVVEMSTIGPEAVRELRALLPAEVGLVDAPVLGSVGPAADGTLTVLAGGDVSGCREVLSVFGSVRELGAGQERPIRRQGGPAPGSVIASGTAGRAGTESRGSKACGDSVRPSLVAQVDEAGSRRSAAYAAQAESSVFAPESASIAGPRDQGAETRRPEGASMATPARARLQEARAAGLGERDLTAIAEHAGGDPAHRAVPLNLSTIPATNGRYSHAVRVGDMLYVSGQAAFDEHGDLVGEGSMAAQSEHIFQVVSRILADQGATFEDIAFIRTYVTDMDQLIEYGRVRAKYITGTPPASTTVEVSRLFRPGLLLEVDLIVALPR